MAEIGYQIVVADSIALLEALVRDRQAIGWVCVGNLVIHSNNWPIESCPKTYYQGMVKPA